MMEMPASWLLIQWRVNGTLCRINASIMLRSELRTYVDSIPANQAPRVARHFFDRCCICKIDEGSYDDNQTNYVLKSLDQEEAGESRYRRWKIRPVKCMAF